MFDDITVPEDVVNREWREGSVYSVVIWPNFEEAFKIIYRKLQHLGCVSVEKDHLELEVYQDNDQHVLLVVKGRKFQAKFTLQEFVFKERGL